MSDDDKLKEIKKLFKRSQEWEQQARQNFDNDQRFADGDSYNMYQWPQNVIDDRKLVDRPCLTTNIVRQHNLQIINDALQNKPGIKYRAVTAGASKEAAGIWDDIARNIEYESNFPAILDGAMSFVVKAGYAAWRIITEYEDDETFNQVIRIAPIKDPRTLYTDPDAQAPDKSDMKYAFIFSDIPKEEWNRRYPRYKEISIDATYLDEEYNWVLKDHIRVAEYFYIEYRSDKLLMVEDPETGESLTIYESELKRDAVRVIKADAATQVRPVEVPQVKWMLIAGNKVVDKRDLPGKYIPVVPVIAEETVIDGVMDRKGHTRAMLDSQRMYNYWNSASVEFVALQSKTPWVAPVEAVDGYEDYWNNANAENMAYLPYRSKGEDGEQIPPPQRPPAPVQAQGYVQGAQMARAEMMTATGQYENTLGQPGNERTGKAISQRQMQGDRATYHFVNAMARSIRLTGIIIQDLFPHIYDVQRTMELMGENGQTYEVMVDPKAKAAVEKRNVATQAGMQLVFNPKIGKYSVYADVGPGYATKREEAWNAFNNILTQAPQLTGVIGDLLMLAGDFPHSTEAAERLRRMVPKEALGEGPSPQELQLQQQLQQVQATLAQLTEENATLRIAARGRDEANLVNAYKGQTERLKTLSELMQVPPEVLAGAMEDLVRDSVDTAMQAFAVSSAKQTALPPPVQGAAASVAGAASMPGQMDPRIAEMFKPQGNPLLGSKVQ